MSKIENAENVRLFALNSNQPLARRLSETDCKTYTLRMAKSRLLSMKAFVVAKYMFCNPFLSRLTPI